ncbi:MAG TPA: succinate dehydrogenase, cytochrome b556 subunit [Steroidobacteraceae bacterium]|jgi:succinate dehydrogenase / fumarate reductase cytochrome b subunit|nr:succinate dehydrogenase, cytochrome b556 subunit [Steroidobacteraceae bacterium]
MPDRPLSPHLSIYRWKYTLVSSIANRITGLALTAGFLVLLYWIMAILGGPATYQRAEDVLGHPIFKVILSGFLFAFSYHLIAGIRHLIWDTARGMERRQSQTSAWLVGALSVVLTLVLIYWAFCPAVPR